MWSFDYKGRTFEVEIKQMSSYAINVAFLDEDDFGSIFDWASNADLSVIEIEDEEGNTKSYEGYSMLKSIVAMNATEYDFWEGMRMVVVLEKPSEEEEQ